MKDRLAVRAAWLASAAMGFWALGLGLALALAASARAIVLYAPEYSFAALAPIVLAGWVLLGLMPDLGRSETETPALSESEHPRLHAFVRDVASRVGSRRPDALILFHDANAFAGLHRPRVFARKKSMVGLGLPFLSVLTTSELGAVLAHELGHHVAGDVRLGPWVHRTRRAIARAVDRLEGSSFWLHLPFVAYADFFLSTSLRISRAQELQADAVAARVAGAETTASALRKIELLSGAWGMYFASEVRPLLEKKRVPPLLEGFDLYWKAAQTPETPAFRALAEELSRSEPRTDDTHPSLAERITSLGNPSPAPDASPIALALLDDVRHAENLVVRSILRDPTTALEPIAWDAIVDAVWLPTWREMAAENANPLADLMPSQLPSILHDRARELAEATRRGLAVFSPEAERRRLARLLGAWLAVHLADRGFRLRSAPGCAVVAERDDECVEPFAIAIGIADGTKDAGAWRERCAELGLA